MDTVGDGAVQDVREFLLDVEEAIKRTLEWCNESMASVEEVEGILVQAELLFRDVVTVDGILNLPGGEVMVQAVSNIVSTIQDLSDDCHRQHARGRPRILISEEQLTTLLELHFSNRAIANLLQVSPRTIRRRIIEYGLVEESSFAPISDADLDSTTQQFIDTHPNSGERSLSGYLRGLGLKVQRS